MMQCDGEGREDAGTDDFEWIDTLTQKQERQRHYPEENEEDEDGRGTMAMLPRNCPQFTRHLVSRSPSCIPIRGSSRVCKEAFLEAHRRLARAWRRQPNALKRMEAFRCECHIIPCDSPSSSLPNLAHLLSPANRQRREEFDERMRGTGGAFCSVGEENLLCAFEDRRIRKKDSRYGDRDILAHESAHTLMNFGLDEIQRRRIRDTYRRSVEELGRWTRASGERAYAGTNADEYFAELSMWYWGSRGEFVDHTRSIPAAGREALRLYDPEGFSLLESIYSGSVDASLEPHTWHIHIKADRTCRSDEGPSRLRLRSRKHDVSSNAQNTAIHIMFMNRTDHDLVCSWVDCKDLDGDSDSDSTMDISSVSSRRVQYATVSAHGIFVQPTFVNHLWLLERLGVGDEPLVYSERSWSCFAPTEDAIVEVNET